MRVELLWWEGCPSYDEALGVLREAMQAEGMDPGGVELRHVDSDDEAARERFPGSPTIRVDGRDVVEPPDGEPFGLSCRVYRLRDGRYSPVPDRADLAAALRRREQG